MTETFNIASRLDETAGKIPFKRAAVKPLGYDSAGRRAYIHLTYRQIIELCDRYAKGLNDYGIGRGVKTLVMVNPGPEFVALVFALFKTGAVPVMIDPGMGIKRMAECIRSVSPEAMVAIRKAHLLRFLKHRQLKSVKYPVFMGKKPFYLSGVSLREITPPESAPFTPVETTREDLAAILFTTGSTGPAKGVCYLHKTFDTQVELFREIFDARPGEDIDMPGFPLFALFSVSLGMTAVFPDMDPTRPARADPAKIVEIIQDQGVTFSFGSPALWKRVAAYCKKRHLTLPSLKNVVIAGAAVSGSILRDMRDIMPSGETWTPYGATESLPATVISGSEILSETWSRSIFGAGACVGKPVKGMECRIIGITDEPIDEFSEDLAVPDGETGEICFKGPQVTKEYYNQPEAVKMAKMTDPRDGEIWHRMGDLGYLDEKGRLWYCGRKSHRVVGQDKTWYTVKCEAIFNEHPDVARSALVGIGTSGSRTPVIIIEPVPGKMPGTPVQREQFKKSIIELGLNSQETKDISIVLFHPSFPVDIRHNAKIFREQLRVWAEKQLK